MEENMKNNNNEFLRVIIVFTRTKSSGLGRATKNIKKHVVKTIVQADPGVEVSVAKHCNSLTRLAMT